MMNETNAKVYLIPTVLAEDALKTIPTYIVDAIKDCTVFYVENERTSRRFFKSIYKEMIIDDMEWVTIHKAEHAVKQQFTKHLQLGKNIAIVSEAGCPGIADPGQILIAVAQEKNAIIKPLVGPSSILLSLMASGLNGQQFTFNGYLPIDNTERIKKIKELEAIVIKDTTTQIFIETPYRNNQLLESIVKNCAPTTLLCIAVDLTDTNELVQTKPISYWKTSTIDLHKKPCIFLLGKQF
jgi:16S rRNA (cytidine1402-2'-O)-methyltransferase